MTYEQVEGALQQKLAKERIFQIKFKDRDSIRGLFIKTSDYGELSRKNLWRIVNEKHIDQYRKSNDESLARIFSGIEFTRLEILS